jgi:hypothetical protein
MFKHSLSAALSLSLLTPALVPAQAGETKTVILLETGEAIPLQSGAFSKEDVNSKRVQQCMELSKSESKELRGEVFVEMRLDPDCAGMAFANNFIDVGSFGKEADYINATVGYFPTTNEKVWWLNIVTINGKKGPDYMGGKASSAKEIAHNLCYIIHQEKNTRR